MAPLLIVLRVAAGYSRPESEWNSAHNKTITDLRNWRTTGTVTTDHTMTIELEQNPGHQFQSLEGPSGAKQGEVLAQIMAQCFSCKFFVADSEEPLGVNIVVTETKSYI